MSLKDWFDKTFPEAPPVIRAARRSVPRLEAFHWTGESPGLDVVKNVSASGMYLLTKERWPQGQINPIRLTTEDMPVEAPGHDVEIQAVAVRWGEDGMGLRFLLPESMEIFLWKTRDEPQASDVIKEFRIAQVVAFLLHICPSGAEELKLLFRNELSSIRTLNTVEIGIRAEQIMARQPGTENFRIPKSLLMRIIECGSWAEDDLVRQFWAGLLVTSCSTDGFDESIRVYVELLSQFAITQARIFGAVCGRCTKNLSNPDRTTALPISMTAEQLMEIAGARDRVKIDRDLMHLSSAHLMSAEIRARSLFSYSEDAEITPTPMALEMYARCQGHRGSPHDFYSQSPSTTTVVWNKKFLRKF
jgi:hypothetical protein